MYNTHICTVSVRSQYNYIICMYFLLCLYYACIHVWWPWAFICSIHTFNHKPKHPWSALSTRLRFVWVNAQLTAVTLQLHFLPLRIMLHIIMNQSCTSRLQQWHQSKIRAHLPTPISQAELQGHVRYNQLPIDNELDIAVSSNKTNNGNGMFQSTENTWWSCSWVRKEIRSQSSSNQRHINVVLV